MIDYLLDTNAVITLLNDRSPALVERVTKSTPGSIGVPTIVAHELYLGAYRSQRVEFNLESLRLLFADFPTLDFSRDDAHSAGQIRSGLLRLGTPIGPYDVLIAGQAKARNLTLVTNNTSEFARVEGLSIEDWTR
ncbi:type II toxin-antitoxin system VapC family toxin [Devosia psychrophila]|uniref:Ribonuclease VapC n=1 Tax=Devosia psychrophila TaxID=728005 RepID=A0A0F5PUU7_9HYPH|nr:type II toxin-antitoxin system VapC family toxin [Devosia psychrophila]KKC32408.1 pilus assembly protein [Devosia psychrophila]SFC13986.1 tRNA(fMet)-specific endonuclease VapC [Devosia psychrophila]